MTVHSVHAHLNHASSVIPALCAHVKTIRSLADVNCVAFVSLFHGMHMQTQLSGMQQKHQRMHDNSHA